MDPVTLTTILIGLLQAAGKVTDLLDKHSKGEQPTADDFAAAQAETKRLLAEANALIDDA